MPFLLLLSFLFMLYASPSLLVPALGAVRPAQLAGIGAMAVLVFQKMTSGQRWKLGWPDGFLLASLIGVAGLSCATAFWPHLAVETTLDFAKIGLIFFVIVNCVDSEERLGWTTLILVLGGILPAVGTVVNYLHGNFVEGNRAAWIGTFANPNDLAYSLVILIPLAYQMGRNAHWALKPVFWAILAVYFAAIFAAHSRGGMMGAAAVLLVMVLRQPGLVSKVVIAAALVGVAVFANYYWTRNAGFQNLDQDFTVHQRIETIRAGIRMFGDYPLLGVGLGCSIVAFPLYASSGIDFRGALVIHNTAVQSLSELGVLGFIPFVLLVASALYHARRVSKRSSLPNRLRNYAIAYEAAICGFVVCGLSGGYVVSWFPYIIMGLIVALTYLSAGSEVLDEQ